MVRTFDPSRTRRRRTLDGNWEFVTDPEERGREAGYPESFPEDAERIAVPSPWNVRSEYHDYTGVGWYHTTFDVTRDGIVRLAFHGVCHDADVYLDGERVANHYGGYTPFEAVDRLERGTHSLVVRVDGSRDERSVPKPGTDWFPYGGITREVVVEELPERWVSDVDIEYELRPGGSDGERNEERAAVTASVTVRNAGDAGERQVAVEIGDERVATTVELPADSERTVRLSHDFPVERWTLSDPVLYTVTASVGRSGNEEQRDELRERVGFRTVSVEGRGVCLNGEPLQIRGVNRHEDHPEWGHTQPLRVQEMDLDLIADAGMNLVRTSHYPAHPRFLDLCDERGILVLEELPYWQFDGARFDREGVLERGKSMLREMIQRDRSHPSVLLWGLTNECAGHEERVQEAVAELAGLARELDDRPLTLASMNYQPNQVGRDPTFEHCDVVCLNGYQGWYTDGPWSEMLDPAREDYPEKPILVSEFGAGAVYGERTRENQKWSEGYQADVVCDAVETFEAVEGVVGFTVWQFCDTRTTAERFAGRPKTKNNKGIVDEYRRPKVAYDRLQELLTEE